MDRNGGKRATGSATFNLRCAVWPAMEGVGVSADKSPTSEVTAANKQTESARDGLAYCFLFFGGH